MLGFLNVNKPKGQTSRAVVDAVQRRFRRVKVGHCGTLDPLASGVLVIAVGGATRLVEEIQGLPKTYLAEVCLGANSATDDGEGPIHPVADAPVPTAESLDQALRAFVGTFLQEPPAFSAVHLGKKRAYHLARKGRAVPVPARPVTVYSLELLNYSWPNVRLKVVCGKGTYLRSLARDLGRSLGCGGYVAELCRTAVGPFSLEDALALPQERDELRSALVPVPRALAHLPTLELSPVELEGLRHGKAVAATVAGSVTPGSSTARGLVHDGEQQALLLVEREPAGWVCRKRITLLSPRTSSHTSTPVLPKPPASP